MSDDHRTLTVRLSAAQKALLEELAQKTGKSISANVHAALATIISHKLGKDWPTPVDGRARKTPRPKPPVVTIPRRQPLEHVEWFWRRLRHVTDHPEDMSLEGWIELHNVYEHHIKASFGTEVSRTWHLIDTHRDPKHFGDHIKSMPKDSLERKLALALWYYESVRDEWCPKWRSLYGGVDRAELAPGRLEKLRAGEARRQKNRRRRLAAEREARHAAFEAMHVSGIENDTDYDLDFDGSLESPAERRSVPESGCPSAPTGEEAA